MKVILADPENQFKSTVYKLLRDQGFECLEASGVQQLGAIAFSEQIEAIAIAHYLYNHECQELITRLRNTEGYGVIPIYMITKNDEISMARDLYRLGVTEVYRKSDIALINQSFQRLYEFRTRVLEGKVLYIEPEPEIANLVQGLLHNLKLKVYHYSSIEKALEAFDRSTFDLVITCIIGSGKYTGQHLIRRVRQHINKQKRRTPIIVLTSVEDSARQLECFNLGADDFIRKIAVREELVARVNNVITKHELITSLRQRARILQRFAIYDSLSNLYNRRGILEIAPAIFADAVRTSSPLSLLLIDLDYFKQINDTFGHAEGDNVIKAVARVILASLKEQDIVARWGGDEFVVLLPNCQLSEAQLVAERILLKIRTIRPDTNFSCSIGVALVDFNKVFTLEALVKEADRALYYAKREGRSRVATLQSNLLAI